MKNPERSNAPEPPGFLVVALVLLAAVSLIGSGFFESYAINSDVTSYFDLADQIQNRHWTWVVNGYWNPLYPALLAVARSVTHADVWHEMQAGRMLNVVTAIFVLLASVYFADSALRLSLSRTDPQAPEAGVARPPRGVVLLAAVLITFWLIVRNLSVSTVRPDLVLTFFLIIAFSAVCHIVRAAKMYHFVLLGAAFALAYLTKSVAFPVFVFTVLVLAVMGVRRRRYIAGVGLAVVIFGIVAGPYIFALSRRVHHFSTGESGGDNYAWYVDGAARFDQQAGESATKGKAIDHLKHTSKELLINPPVYFYGDWMPGTEPQWFDPSYWNAGLTPHFALRPQISVLIGNVEMLARVCISNIQIFIPLAVLFFLGGRWLARDWGSSGFGPAALVAIALIGLYLIVLLEGRYVAPSFLVLVAGAIAFAYIPARSSVRVALSYSLLALFAALVFTDIQSWMRSAREQKETEGTSLGAYNREIWTAAQSLISDFGIKPGDTVACYGEGACRSDLTWARLARANIRTEVHVEQDDAVKDWAQAQTNEAFYPALRGTGAKVLVGRFGPGTSAPAPWRRLGRGDLFVIDLRPGSSSRVGVK
jgi:hypothetical protein